MAATLAAPLLAGWGMAHRAEAAPLAGLQGQLATTAPAEASLQPVYWVWIHHHRYWREPHHRPPPPHYDHR